MIIEYDEAIIKLEEGGRWNEAVRTLYERWTLDQNNINNLLCVGGEAWYVLTFFVDRLIEIDGITRDELITILLDTYDYGICHFKNNAYFNAIFGYFIVIMPYMFLRPGSTIGASIDEMGLDMIARAHALAPEDREISRMYEVSVLGLFDTPCNANFNWGNSELQMYFHRIYCSTDDGSVC